jgi:hypothetical protein
MVIKTYATETPLNSAALASTQPYVRLFFLSALVIFWSNCMQVLLGGGLTAMLVTTTSHGKFETRFWHKVYEEEVGRVKGHFGPINTCVFVSVLCSLLTSTQNRGTSGGNVLRVWWGGWICTAASFRRVILAARGCRC